MFENEELEFEEDNESLFTDDTLEDAPEEDVDLEDEDVDEELSDEETLEDPEEQDDAEEQDDSTEEPTKPQPLFDKKQQAEVNKIVKERLDRQNSALLRDLSKSAGVEIAHDEVTSATRLWGLLKANPNLSKEVDGLIAFAFQKGSAKAPDAPETSVDAITQRLELKEAILDLKASDTLFSKNADGVVAWAENEGYEITNGKSLKLAYLAWKGTQGKLAEAVQKSTAKRKQETKKIMQKRATVQSAKAGVRTGTSDFRRMTDSAVLASEGLSLFNDD